jgi:hypothetical protein
LRPADPTTLEFELDHSNIPDGFFQQDVMVKERRHLIFSTEKQLQLLSRAKTWYIDSTFHVVKAPFTQLFSIHAFLKSSDDTTKQVPLAYAFMSGKSKRDYKHVLEKIVDSLPCQPKVNTFVLDFEAAMWKAIQGLYPEVNLQGCAFHWTQAVWRKLQSLGMFLPNITIILIYLVY